MKRLIFGVLASILSVFALSAANLHDMRASNSIKIGVLNNHAPFSKDENGTFSGFEIDLAKEIADYIFHGKEHTLEFVSLAPNERVAALDENRVDLLLALMPITDNSKPLVDFSTPYLRINTAIVTKPGEVFEGCKKLGDKKIALQEKMIAKDWLYFQGCSDKNFMIVNSFKECYLSLTKGEVEICMGDTISMMSHSLLESVNIENQVVGPRNFIAAAVKKGNITLLMAVNNAILALTKDGFFKESSIAIFDPFFYETVDMNKEELYHFK